MISANCATLFLECSASACAAALRLAPERSCISVERRLDRERFAGYLEAQISDRGVELPIPGRVARHRLFVEQLLDAILELIGFVAAHVVEPWPVMAERGIGHRGFKNGVLDAIEFEREEQQMRRRRRHALLNIAVEFRPRRIDGIAGVDETRIGTEPAHQIIDRFVTPHRGSKRLTTFSRRRQACELALEGFLKA